MKRLILLVNLMLLLLFYFSGINCTDKNKINAVIYDGEELKGHHEIPFRLHQNSPDPFNGYTTIKFDITMGMHATIKVFTEDWLEVETLLDRDLEFKPSITGSNYYQISFSPSLELPSGEYYYTMEALGYTIVRKMMLIK